MIDFQKNFLKEYQKLNPEQKKAVDTIDGPVMVLAGPGTGKTQTIALRIANILQKTDTPTSSILCLTFTDNASLNMRQRLETLIGPLIPFRSTLSILFVTKLSNLIRIDFHSLI